MIDTPEAFALLAAEVWVPFREHERALREAGLDEARFKELCVNWQRRFEQDVELARRFGDAFAHAKASPGEIVETAAEGGFLSPALAFRDEAANVKLSADEAAMPIPPAGDERATPMAREEQHPAPSFQRHAAPEDDLDRTSEIHHVMLGPSLPFRAGTPVLPDPTPASDLLRDVSEFVGGTFELKLVPKTRALPFAGQATLPARRLIHFNPQTGERLAEPIWETIPSPSEEGPPDASSSPQPEPKK